MIDTVIPEELRSCPQWVCWRYQMVRGKPTKIPINPYTRIKASSTNPSTWVGYAQASYAAHNPYRWLDGVGFVFSEQDSFYGVDIDNCIDHRGQLSLLAEELVYRFNTYTEISPSKRGIKLFVRKNSDITIPTFIHRNGWPLEIYPKERYFTVTGRHIEFTPRIINSDDTFISSLITKITTTHPDGTLIAEPQQFNHNGDVSRSINDIIIAIINSKASRKFLKLQQGDWSDYPSRSEADLALLNILSYFTGGDIPTMLEVAYSTELQRSKWQRPNADGSTYIEHQAIVATKR